MKTKISFVGTASDFTDNQGRRLVTIVANVPSLAEFAANAPNYLNPREVNVKKNPHAKKMAAQLREAPEDFCSKNLGIYAAVGAGGIRVSKETNSVIVEIESTFNGGHTTQVINAAIAEQVSLTKAYVVMKFHQGYSAEEIREIAEAVNATKPVTAMAFANQAGFFDELKDYLSLEFRKRVIFKDNDTEAPGAKHDGSDLARMALVMNPKLFPVERGLKALRSPSSLYSAKGGGMKIVKNTNHLNEMAGLIDEIVALEGRIVRWFDEHNGRNAKTDKVKDKIPLSDYGKEGSKNATIAQSMVTISGYGSSITPPDGLILMTLSAFRPFVCDGKLMEGKEETSTTELWERYGDLACRTAWNGFIEADTTFEVYGKTAASWRAVLDAVINAMK